jgi:hypothetical protein
MQTSGERRKRRAGGRGRPLVVTGDGELLDELLDLAGAAGVELAVAVDAIAAEDHWASAPLVMVGPDQVEALARRHLPYRLGVVLVTRQDVVSPAGGPAEPGAWSGAEALHAEHVVLLPDARSWLVARLAESRPRALRHAAPVVAFVSASAGAGASTLAAGLGVVARRQGLSALLVGADPARVLAEQAVGPPGGGGTLAILNFGSGDATGVPPDAMAAALRAARHGRDLVVVDLPHPFDAAARLALSSADRCYVVVAAEIRACAAAVRVAAAIRRHCPGLALVVRAVVPGGLRPGEVAEALDLPLAGVLPSPAGDPTGSSLDAGLRAVTGLGRRLLAESGARRRAPAGLAAGPPAAAVVNR